MKPAIFNSPIQFYAPAAMAAAARDKAREEGRTLSEVMRSALRRELADAA